MKPIEESRYSAVKRSDQEYVILNEGRDYAICENSAALTTLLYALRRTEDEFVEDLFVDTQKYVTQVLLDFNENPPLTARQVRNWPNI